MPASQLGKRKKEYTEKSLHRISRKIWSLELDTGNPNRRTLFYFALMKSIINGYFFVVLCSIRTWYVFFGRLLLV